MKTEIPLDLILCIGFALLALYFTAIKDKKKQEPFKGFQFLWGVVVALTIILIVLKPESYGLPGFIRFFTQSEVLLDITVCLGTSFAVFLFLWSRENQKREVLAGYLTFGVLSGFGSFLLVHLIFRDYGLAGSVKFLIAFCFSLMSTHSPHFLTLTNKGRNKRDVEELPNEEK